MSYETKIVYEDVTESKIKDELKRQSEAFFRDTSARKTKMRQEAKQISEDMKKKLAEVDKKIDTLREYKFGKFRGLEEFEDLYIRDMQRYGGLRIGMFGPAGSGKSSFISTCERTIKKRLIGSADVKTEGGEGTIRVMDYLCGTWQFKLIDTRGFGDYGRSELLAFSDILSGNVKLGEEIDFANKANSFGKEGEIKDRIHQVVFVISAIDPRLQNGRLVDYFNPMRNKMRPNGLAAVTVLTHLDKIDMKEKEKIKDAASRTTGCDPSKLYFIKNYSTENERDPDIENVACDLLMSAIRMGERYVKISKKRQDHQTQNPMACIQKGEDLNVLFQQVKRKHSLPEANLNRLRDELSEVGIRTTFALYTLWDKVVSNIKMSGPMKKYLLMAMKERI